MLKNKILNPNFLSLGLGGGGGGGVNSDKLIAIIPCWPMISHY